MQLFWLFKFNAFIVFLSRTSPKPFSLPIFYNHRLTPLEKRNFFYFLKSCFSCQERLFFYPEYSQHIFFSCLFCPKKKHGKCLIFWTKLWTKGFFSIKDVVKNIFPCLFFRKMNKSQSFDQNHGLNSTCSTF